MSAIEGQRQRARNADPTPLARMLSPRVLAALGGYSLLMSALVFVLFLPNGWPPVILAGGAALLLSFDRKLGPIPAAMFVMLALPVGRGSEVGLPRIGDVPIRAHDIVPMVAVTLALPAMARRLTAPMTIHWSSVVPVALFSGIGVVALVVGLSGDQAMRDIVRDTRWWAYYGIGIVALVAGTRRPAVMRALIWGLTIYAAVLLIALLMPMFHGGLKYGAYAYDPRLRLHYGQAVFVIVAAAIVVARFVRRPSPSGIAVLGLLGAATGVTLTRTLLAGIIGVAVLVAVWTAVELLRRPERLARAIAIRAALAALAVAMGVGAGFAAYSFGTTIWTPDWAYAREASDVSGQPSEARPVRPSLDRVFDDTDNSGFDAQAGGRLTSYALALQDIVESPVIGRGLGQQARIPWAWGGFRAREAGSQPGVDNAYLTVGLKAGALGIAAFGAMVLWPLRQLLRPHRRRLRAWYVPAWLAILGLTLLQSFAVIGYAPFVLATLVVLPGLGSGDARRRRSI
jgi:hypothetical protein